MTAYLEITKKGRRSPNWDSRFESQQIDEVSCVCPRCKYEDWYNIKYLQHNRPIPCPACLKLKQLQNKICSLDYASNEVFLQ